MKNQSLLLLAILPGLATAQVGLDQTPDDPAETSPREESQEASIPLDPSDPTFNLWKTMRKDMAEGREPGPINIQKSPGGFAFAGIPTFFKLPVALLPADLKAGKVDVAIMGGLTDMAGGMRGAAWGPEAVRTSEKYLPWGVMSGPHNHTQVNPFEVLNCVDYGDSPVDFMSTERSVHAIRDFIREAVEVKHDDGRHVIPILVGGDHSLLYPSCAAMADVYGKGKVGVIHFDAHQDGSKDFMGHLIAHGMPIARLIKEGHILGKNFIQVGIRGYRPDPGTMKWMREEGFRYHTMAEIEKRGWDAVLKDVIKEANDGTEYLYISFDMDVIDPAYVPGTGTPEPGGLTPREVFPLVRRLCAESNVVGCDVVELNPQVDPGYVSALTANRVIREMLTGIAMRRKGLTDPHYLAPISVDDDRE